MKTILIALILSLVVSTSFSQGINFEHGSWNEALAKASKEDKLIFLDAYTTWCGPCKKMEKQVFIQPEVGTYFNANFINVKMDMEKGEGPDLVKKYNIKAYPTYLIINSKGDVVHEFYGFLEAEPLIAKAKEANR